MARYDIERRSFLLSAAAGSAGTLWTGGRPPALPAQTPAQLKITEPFHGAVLNHRHGTQSNSGLSIRVSGEASRAVRVTVNVIAVLFWRSGGMKRLWSIKMRKGNGRSIKGLDNYKFSP